MKGITDHNTAVEYLKSINVHPSEVGWNTKSEDGERYQVPKRITKLVMQMEKKGIHLDAQELARDLSTDTSEFGDLIPNDYTQPLNLQQKEYIRDHLSHMSPQKIASYVLTNPQNVRLAQRGEFSTRERKASKRWNNSEMPAPAPEVPELTSKRPYGPLSLEDKIDIYDNHQDVRVADLAKVYNTSTTNIHNAKEGRFKRPKDNRSAKDMLNDILANLVGKNYRITCDNDLSIDLDVDETLTKLMKGEAL